MSIDYLLSKAEGSNTLYNVTFDITDQSTVLSPRVPYSVADDEDNDTCRVCLSDSIEKCIEAIGPCNRDFCIGQTIVVRSVKVKDLDQEKLIGYNDLYLSGKVPDAPYTHEYWYLDELPVERKVFLVKGFTYEHCLAWELIKLKDVMKISCKYCDDSVRRMVYTAKDLYDKVCRSLEMQKLYDTYDRFTEEIESLPWAQACRVSDLILEECTEFSSLRSVIESDASKVSVESYIGTTLVCKASASVDMFEYSVNIRSWFTQDGYKNHGYGRETMRRLLLHVKYLLSRIDIATYTWNGTNEYVLNFIQNRLGAVCICPIAIQKKCPDDDWSSHIYNLDINKVVEYFRI